MVVIKKMGDQTDVGTITMKDLDSYTALKRECAELSSRIQRLCEQPRIEQDTVKGSMPVWPYVERTVVVEGESEASKNQFYSLCHRLEDRKARSAEKLHAIEAWLDTLDDDPKLRMIVQLRYIDGLPWRQVATKAYGAPWYEDAARKKVGRLF